MADGRISRVGPAIRRGIRVLFATVPLLIVLLLAAGWVLLRTEWSLRTILGSGLPTLNAILPGRIEISSSEGALVGGFRLVGVRAFDERGDPFIDVAHLDIDLSFLDLVDVYMGSINVVGIALHEPRVRIVQRDDGSWNVVAAFVAPGGEEKASGPGARLRAALSRAQITSGHFELRRPGAEDLVIDGINLDGRWSMVGPDQDIAVRRLTLDVAAPWDVVPIDLAGGVQIISGALLLDDVRLDHGGGGIGASGTLGPLAAVAPDLRFRLDAFDLQRLDAFAPGALPHGVLDGELRLWGTPADLSLDGQLAVDGGGIVEIDLLRLDRRDDGFGHEARLRVRELRLDTLLPGRSLPEPISARLTWSGSGRSGADLTGAFLLGTDRVPLPSGPVQAVDWVEARGRIDAGLLSVESARVGVFGGTVDAEGAVDLRGGPVDLHLSAALPHLQELPRAWTGGVVAQRIRATATVAGRWSGKGEGGPLYDGAASLGVEVAQWSRASISAAATTLSWNGSTTVGRSGVPAIHGPLLLRLSDPGLGDLRAQSLALDLGLEGAKASVRFTLDRPASADQSAFSTLIAGTLDWTALPTAEAEIGRFDLSHSTEEVHQEGPIRVSTNGEAMRVQGFDLRSGAAALSGGLRHSPAATDVDLVLTGLDLRRLAPYLPSDLGLAGQVDSLRVKSRGPLDAPVLDLGTKVAGVVAAERGPFTLDGALHHEGGKVSGRLGLGDFGALTLDSIPAALSFASPAPVVLDPRGVIACRWDLPQTGWEVLRTSLALPEVAGMSGATSTIKVALGGTVADPTVEVGASLSDLRLQTQVGAVRLMAEVRGGAARLWDTTLRTSKDGSVLALSATAAMPLGPYLLAKWGPVEGRGPPPLIIRDPQATVELRKLPMPLIHDFVPALAPLTGALQGELLVRGTATAPTLDLDLRLLGGRIGKRGLDNALVDLAISEGRLGGRVEIAAEGGGRLVVAPRAPVPLVFDGSRPLSDAWSQPGLHVDVMGTGFPLSHVAAFVPGATDAAGLLRIEGVVRGSLVAPVPDLQLRSEGSTLCLSSTSVCYEDLDVDVDVDRDEVRVTHLRARTVPVVQDVLDATRRPAFDGGPKPHKLVLSGRVGLESLVPTVLDLRLDLEDSWLAFTREAKAQARGSITATGPPDAPIVRGDVTLTSLTVDLGRDDFARDAVPLLLPDVLRVHRTDSRAGPGERRVLSEERVPSVLDKLDAAVALHLGSVVRVRLAVGVARQSHEVGRALNMLGSIEPDLSLSGDLSVRMQQGRATLEGQVTTGADSKLGILTKRFDMEQGSSLTFVGDPLDTRIAMRAGHKSRYGTITAVITGTPARPNLDWESEDFTEAADMISVVVTGKPMDELSAAEGGQVQAGLVSFLSGFATKIAGRVVPLDSVDLELEDGFRAGSFEAGKALAPGVVLFVVIRWGADEEENRIEAQLQFQIDRRTYLETSLGDRGKGAAEVRWRVQF